jgi:hypothetical protein
VGKWPRALGGGGFTVCTCGVWVDLPTRLMHLLGHLERKPSYTYRARGQDMWLRVAGLVRQECIVRAKSTESVRRIGV